MHDIEERTVIIRDSVRDLPKRYAHNEESIKKLDLETQDILHVIELGKVDAIGRQRIFEELRCIRQERRKLKDENELLAPIVDTLQGIKNKLPELDRGLGKIRKTKMAQNNRKYGFRVRHDLGKMLKG